MGHVHTYIHFDKNGKPLDPSSGAFSKLKKSEKQHTKFFFEKEFDRLTPIKDILRGQISEKLKKRQKLSPFEIASGSKRRLENPSTPPSELNPKRRLVDQPEQESAESDAEVGGKDNQSNTALEEDKEGPRAHVEVEEEQITDTVTELHLQETDSETETSIGNVETREDTEIESDGDDKDEMGDTMQEEKEIQTDLKKLVLSRLDEISKSLKVGEEGHETLSDEIVRKVTENIADLIHGEESKITGNEIWDKDEQSWVCRASIRYSESNERPTKLDKYHKNNFGILSITRQGEDSTKKTRKIEKENRQYHEKSPLHIWCLQKYQKEKDTQKTESQKNEEGAKKLVRNAVFCLQNSWSAHTYRKLNSLIKIFLMIKIFRQRMMESKISLKFEK